MNLYEIVQMLCDENNIKIAQLERDLHFGNGSIRKWKDTIPSGDRLVAVADYFDVSVDYLLGRTKRRFADLVKEKGVSLEQLSNQLNIPYINLKRAEENVRELDVIDILKLSDYFKVTTDYLYGLADRRNQFSWGEDYLKNGVMSSLVKELLIIKKSKGSTNEEISQELNISIEAIDKMFNKEFTGINIKIIELVAGYFGYTLYDLQEMQYSKMDIKQNLIDIVQGLDNEEDISTVYKMIKKVTGFYSSDNDETDNNLEASEEISPPYPDVPYKMVTIKKDKSKKSDIN